MRNTYFNGFYFEKVDVIENFGVILNRPVTIFQQIEFSRNSDENIRVFRNKYC